MILVNNRDKIEWEEGMTITRLLEKCRFTAHQINVFVNDKLVDRQAYPVYPVRDGDRVRVIHFIAGGC